MAEKKGEKGGNGLLQALSRGRKEAAKDNFFCVEPISRRLFLLEVYGGGGTHTTVGKCASKKTRARREFLASFPPPARWT